MYILIISNNQKEINLIKKSLSKYFTSPRYLITDNEVDARDMIDNNQISLALIGVKDSEDINIAKIIAKKNPVVNIIFISDTKDYAYDAFETYASGYIIAPVREEKLEENLLHLRFQLTESTKKRVEIQCFGKFEMFLDGKSIKFGRSKTKELLAYLIDRNGTMCDNNELLLNH